LTLKWFSEVDATLRSRHSWYVTAKHGRLVVTARGTEPVPATSAHLKQLGTRHTVCGLAVHGWVTFWERGPSELPADSCRTCRDALDDERTWTTHSGQ
jgi:hypothetical protein